MSQHAATPPPQLTHPPEPLLRFVEEHPFLLYPRLATLIGNPDRAVIIQQIAYWTHLNHGNPEYMKEGFPWAPLSINGWADSLQGLVSRATVTRSFKQFREMNFLIEKHFNNQGFGKGKTLWRRLDMKVLNELYSELYLDGAPVEVHTSPYFQTEKSILIYPSIARAVGISPALLLQQIHWWIDYNYRKQNVNNWRDGRVWMYRTQEEWIENDFPWISKTETISGYAEELRSAGLIEIEQFGKYDGNRRYWYTIDYDAVQELVLQSHAAYLASKPTPKQPKDSRAQQRGMSRDQTRGISRAQQRGIVPDDVSDESRAQTRGISRAQTRGISRAQERDISHAQEQGVTRAQTQGFIRETIKETIQQTKKESSRAGTPPSDQPAQLSPKNPAAFKDKNQNPKTQLPRAIAVRIRGDLRDKLFEEKPARQHAWASLTDEQATAAIEYAQEQKQNPHDGLTFNTHLIRALDKQAFPTQNKTPTIDPDLEGRAIKYRIARADDNWYHFVANAPPELTDEEAIAEADRRKTLDLSIPLTEIIELMTSGDNKPTDPLILPA